MCMFPSFFFTTMNYINTVHVKHSCLCQAQSVDLRDLPIAQRNLQIAQRNLQIHTLRN